jgi:inosose dehydratase
VVKDAGDRVFHVHIKDLTNEMAEKVRSGEVPFRQATIDGMFVPAGSGDVDLAGIIRYLEGRGYQGWYVLEQDCSLTEDPAPGTGPIEDAKASVEFLAKVAATL